MGIFLGWLLVFFFFFFSLAFGQNHPIALRQRGCEHCEEQGSEEQLSCRTGRQLKQQNRGGEGTQGLNEQRNLNGAQPY